jgi:hypothetical protein
MRPDAIFNLVLQVMISAFRCCVSDNDLSSRTYFPFFQQTILIARINST